MSPAESPAADSPAGAQLTVGADPGNSHADPGATEAAERVAPPRAVTGTVLGLIVITLLAVTLVASGVPGPVRGLAVGLAAVAMPGLALLPAYGRLPVAAALGAVIALSLVVETAVALAMVWGEVWHPVPIGTALLLLSAVVVALRWRSPITALLRSVGSTQVRPTAPSRARPPRRRRPFPMLVAIGLVGAAVGWITAVQQTDPTALDSWGLLRAFPAAWYAALLIVVVMLAGALTGVLRLSERWLATLVGLLTLILYGSAALVESAPRLPWVFKHIAVTRYIELHGSVDPTIDVYQRWPGFFARSAALAQLAGSPNPVQWAGLAEIWFALLDVILILAIARTLSADPRWCWTATSMFVVANWINQNYFAPQALAYSLYLFIALLLLLSLRQPHPRVAAWSKRALGRFGRWGRLPAAEPAEADVAPPGGRPLSTGWLIGVLLVTFAVIVATHQLTPYLILLATVPLFVLGYYRPVWVAPALVVIALAYLIPNLDYIEQHFGVFSGFDPLANATYSPVDRSGRSPAALWAGRASQSLSALLVIIAVVGLIRRLRAGIPRQALVVGWMMLAPMLILTAQSYGGEGRLRVYLFALPWCSLAAAWAFWPKGEPSTGPVRGALAAVLLVLTALFVVSYYQPEADYRLSQSELRAAEWLDAQLAPGDVVLTTGPTFPVLFGPHYDQLLATGSLDSYQQYFPEDYRPRDLRTIATVLAYPTGPGRTFVVFSEDQYRYDVRHGLYDAGELSALEAALRQDHDTDQVYEDGTARVYRVL